MNKNIFLFLGIFLFLFSLAFVSASIGSYAQNSCVDIKIILNTTSINISSIDYPNSTTAISNQLMNSSGGMMFSYNFCDTSTLGSYKFYYFDSEGNVYDNSFEVTPTGQPTNNVQLYSRIFLILLSLLLIFVIQWNKRNVNYDKWYNNLVKKYQEKNWFKWGLSSLGYNFLKNSYIFSYLVGLLGLLILTDLAFFFNVASALAILKIVLEIYTWGSIAVCLVFFSQIQEWIVGWIKDIQDINWGMQK